MATAAADIANSTIGSAKASLRRSRARARLPLQIVGLVSRLAEFAAVCVSSLAALLLLIDRVPAEMLPDYGRVTLLSGVLYLIVAQASGANDLETQISVRNAWARILNAWMVTSLFTIVIGFLLKVTVDFSRLWTLTWFVMGGVALAATRTVSVICTLHWMRRGVFDQRCALFGAGLQGKKVATYILSHGKLALSPIGFFDDRAVQRLDLDSLPLPVLGGLDELVAAIRAGEIEQVIVALPWSAETRLKAVVMALAMLPVRIRLAPDAAGFIYAQRPIVLLGDLPVMTLFERPISGLDHAAKWIEDKLLAIACLILTSPLMLLAAIAIRLDTPGPVFFRQPREGFNSRPFPVWKFRTMHADRCAADAIMQTTRGDPRVTQVGAFLRRTSIDELPQLFNVLMGQMSMIGPRPHAPSTRAGGRLFHEVIASYAARHKVKPGLTGWAQVCGWRGETDTEEKLVRRLEHDLYYIENWSVWFDLYILLRTAAVLLRQKTAY